MPRQKRVRKRLPGLCYHTPTGWFYSIIRDPSHHSGRRWHYWSADEDEARRLYDKQIESLVAEWGKRSPADQVLGDPRAWTMIVLAEQFYVRKRTDGRRLSTLANTNKYLTLFMQWLDAHGFNPRVLGPGDLTSGLLEEYRTQLAENAKIGRVEANHHIEQVRGLLKAARDTYGLSTPPLGIITKLPQRAKEGHGRQQDRTPISWADIEKLLLAADPVDKAILWLSLNCGFTNSDIGSLELADVDLEKAALSGVRPKTGVPRDFSLWKPTVAALRTYLAHHRGKPVNDEFAKLFFVTRRGNPMCWERIDEDHKKHRSDAVKSRYDRLCKRAGVPTQWGAGFRILRHTYATLIGAGDPGHRETQAALAHRTAQQQETYRHDLRAQAKKAHDKLYKAVVANIPTSLPT